MVPVGQRDTEFDVEVVVRATSAGKKLAAGLFRPFGSIDDEAFVRHPQGELFE